MFRVEKAVGAHEDSTPAWGEGQWDHLPRKQRAVDSRGQEGAGLDHPTMGS